MSLICLGFDYDSDTKDKAVRLGSIPTLASNSKQALDKELQFHRPQVPAKVPATF
jgi:hypothetical protein